jgi:hypothetical protein
LFSGDADLPPMEAEVEAEHGVNAIIRLAQLHKGQIKDDQLWIIRWNAKPKADLKQTGVLHGLEADCRFYTSFQLSIQ